ncbi:hypothetical protein T190820D02B_100001 [Tenacibaculum sp. 190524A05c]
MTTDPKKEFASPYLGMANNPISKIDPDGGRTQNPIYDTNGNFRGVDEFGLQGEAIVYDGAFTNGMSQSEILNNGGSYLDNWINSDNFNARAFINIYLHHSELSNRPDWDGIVTIQEGIDWAKANVGARNNPTPDNSLYIHANSIDYGDITINDLPLNEVTPVNFFSSKNTVNSLGSVRLRQSVYALGRVNLIRVHGTSVKIVNDEATDYDWNTGGSLKRKIAINLERIRSGLDDQHGFKAYYYGTGNLNLNLFGK